MIITPDDLEHRERYRLLTGAVLPRPIAWVSSMDRAGNLNLAPFSYFTVASGNPMTLLFCPQASMRTGKQKDTYYNVRAVPEFVVNLVSEDVAEAMNQTSVLLPPDQSEFEWADLTPIPSQVIAVPRVKEAPISFECTLQQIVMIGDGPDGDAVVFGEVQCLHIRDDLYRNEQIDLEAFKPIGRLSGRGYVRVTDTFEMKRPPAPEDAGG